MIDKEDLAELMRDEKKEEARIENLEYEEECRNDRSFEEQEKHDSNMRESDFM